MIVRVTTTEQIRRRTQRLAHLDEQVSTLKATDLLQMSLHRAHQQQLLPPCTGQGHIATGRLVARMHEQGLWTSLLALAMHRTRAEGTWHPGHAPRVDNAMCLHLHAPDARNATTTMNLDHDKEEPARTVLARAIRPHLWAGPIPHLSATNRTSLQVHEGAGAWDLADTELANAVTNQMLELHTTASHPVATA